MKSLLGGHMLKGIGVIVLLLTSFQWSWAQNSPSDVVNVELEQVTEETKEEKKDSPQEIASSDTQTRSSVEKIEVTGSYIKRIDVEGPSPVVTIDKEMFELTGANTVTDLVRESPLFERSSDGGYFRFHGQHAGNTLILLNGLRVPKLGAPGSDFYNGIQGIPTNILERVEMLKDGSSALYGSDAMAGVVNFITKKDYDGAEFSTRVTVPETGAGIEQNYTMAFGKNYNRGSWVTSIQYVRQAGTTHADIGSFYNGTSFDQAATEGSIRPSGAKTLSLDPRCSDGKGGTTRCDDVGNLADDQVRNPKENIAALLTGRYDISSDVSFSMIGMYNRQQTSSFGNPNRIKFNAREGGGPLDLSKLSSNGLSQKLSSNNGFADADITPREEVGFHESNTVQDSFSTQAKLEGYFADTWSWQAEGSYADLISTTDHRNGILDLDIVRSMLESGAYDPSLPFGQKNGALASAVITPREQYVSNLTMARILTTGELFDFNDVWGAGGAVSIAIGAESQFETVGDRNDAIFAQGNISNKKTPNQNGERQISSGFVEMTAFPIENLELQLAGRYDNYSDFGNTTNPKVSLGYRPSKKVLLRASWGTNFHAPSIRNMIFQEDQGFERFRDTSCDAEKEKCSSEYYSFTRYRAPDIGPERGSNYNIGTVIQPHKNWTFTIDQWNFEGTDTIAKIFGDQYTEYEKALGKEGLEREMGVSIERDAEGNILSVRAPEIVNLGERTIRGLDFRVDFNSRMNLFGLPLTGGATFDHSHFLVYKTKRFDSIPFEHREDLEWKNTISLFVSNKIHYYRLAARTVAGGNDNFRSGAQIPTHTEYDFGYTLSAAWGGQFSFGIKNFLNSKIPADRLANNTFVDVSGARDFTAFNPLGRRYYMGYSQTF